MNDFVHCVIESNDSNITVNERGRRANFTNPGRENYKKIKVDGCVITNGKRADWIIHKSSTGSVIVELKGKDINHAWDQIESTYHSEFCSDWLSKKVGFLIVSSRTPNVGSDKNKLEEKARKIGVKLIVSSSNTNFKLEDFL